MSRRGSLGFGAIVAAAALVLAACTGAPEQDQKDEGGADERAGGTLVVALPGDTGGTDALLSDSLNANMVAIQAMEGLLGFEPGTSNIVPLLAEEWDISEDGLTYTFTIREGVSFHDGTDLDAEAVKFNVERWMNIPAALESRVSGDLRSLGGFRENSNIASVEATDTHTLVIQLKKPQRVFLSLLALAPYAIASPEALVAGGADNTVTDPAQITGLQGGEGAWVGTGPFVFREWVPNDHVTLDRNADYWNEDARAYVDTIVYRPIADSSAAVNALQTGEVDIVVQVAPTDVPVLEGADDVQLVTRSESKSISDLRFNLSYDSVADPRVREAIAHAMNRQSYVDAFHSGYGEVADSWMPIGATFYEALDLPDYDPERAKDLLAEAGAEGTSIDFYYPTDVSRAYMPDPRGLFQAITRDLEAVGLTIVPHGLPWSPDYLEQAATGKLSMYILGMTAPQSNPDNWYGPGRFRYVNGQPSGYYSWHNEEVQQLMNEATTATSEDEAAELWSQVHEILREELPSIPILNPIVPAAKASHVQDYVPQGGQLEYMNSVWLEK